ncbi:MAG: hypothetical protein AAGJ46_02030 [Planctomycetota bacterium]
MRVLIFEPQFAGHNLAHAARLAKGVAELGCDVVLSTSRQAAESAEFATHFGDAPPPDLHISDGFTLHHRRGQLRTGGPIGALHTYRALTTAIRETRPQHVYVPCGNSLSRTAVLPLGLGAALRGCGAQAETLMISGRYLQANPSPWRRLRRRLVLNAIAGGPWSRVFHHDDVAWEHFQRHGGRMARLGALMPDPCSPIVESSTQTARHALGLPEEGRALAVIGLIERRKGIEVLLEAFATGAKRFGAEDRLFLLGRCEPAVREMLAGPYAHLVRSGRVVAIDRRLSAEEFGLAVRAADVVSTVYPWHAYTSSILVAAASAGKPVLASDYGWIGRTTRRFRLGQVCNGRSPASVAAAAASALASADQYRPITAAQRLVRYSTDANYVAHWTARLRERLGLGPSPDRVSWEWVTRRQGMPKATVDRRVLPVASATA